MTVFDLHNQHPKATPSDLFRMAVSQTDDEKVCIASLNLAGELHYLKYSLTTKPFLGESVSMYSR